MKDELVLKAQMSQKVSCIMMIPLSLFAEWVFIMRGYEMWQNLNKGWILCAVLVVTYGLSVIYTVQLRIRQVFKTLTVNAEGVCLKRPFGEVRMRWAEIRDWGFSYRGRSKSGANLYEIYFSDHRLENKSEIRKELKTANIVFTDLSAFSESNRTDLRNRVACYTAVSPFEAR